MASVAWIKRHEKGRVFYCRAGWPQSAITLGGGSLANALYLGVLGGFAFMWLQPLAMIMGVIMLSAIGYVSLSTGEKPFQAINNHINPVLARDLLMLLAA